MSCLFCKIVQGEISTDKVYENDDVLAFNDIEPQAPVHVLIIPKDHYPNIQKTPSEDVAKIFDAIKEIAKQLNLDEGFRIVNNCGNFGGQTVDHLHFHLLGKRKLKWPPG
ncbi:histidine triad nucleotide-binding protein [Proteinivorax hydrogeniformans]|uniref:Histidine triad nucleotide-binding protein n=1 Tax=Proteinivorax hydrogeniformans TaxID=1826727 RepID=A0AAU8HWM2_9FIRM